MYQNRKYNVKVVECEKCGSKLRIKGWVYSGKVSVAPFKSCACHEQKIVAHPKYRQSSFN